jgi:hypothetical protein
MSDYEEYLDMMDDLRDNNDDPGYDGDPDDEPIDGVGFADPGGKSALRAATPDNPRDQPCPTCRRPNLLTQIDVQHNYVCDSCADRAEHGGF